MGENNLMTWHNLKNCDSRTSMIKENRVCRNMIEIMIDSSKHGLFSKSYEPLTKEEIVYSKNCNFKRCNGKISYQKCYGKDLMDMRTHMGYLCDVCYRESNLEIEEKKITLKSNQKILEDNSAGNKTEQYRTEELEFIAQQLRNLYRIQVDNLEAVSTPPKFTDNGIEIKNDDNARAYQLYKKIHQNIGLMQSYFRGMEEFFTKKNTVLDYESCMVITLIKDGKTMNMDQINKSLLRSRRNCFSLTDNLSHQFSLANCKILTTCGIADEPRKRTIDLDKCMEILQ